MREFTAVVLVPWQSCERSRLTPANKRHYRMGAHGRGPHARSRGHRPAAPALPSNHPRPSRPSLRIGAVEDARSIELPCGAKIRRRHTHSCKSSDLHARAAANGKGESHPGPGGTIPERSLPRKAGRQVGVAARGTNWRRSRSRTMHHRSADVLVNLSEGHLLRIVGRDADRRPLGATGLRPSPPGSINAASRDGPRTTLPAAGRNVRSCEAWRRASSAGGEGRRTEALTRQRVPEHEPGAGPGPTRRRQPARADQLGTRRPTAALGGPHRAFCGV